MPIVNQENMLSILMNMNPWWQSSIVPKNLLKDFEICLSFWVACVILLFIA